MRILVLVFSPAGSTLKIAKVLEEKLVAANHQVQFLNITGSKELFKENKIKETLLAKVQAHDLICVGSPVYEKHLEYYVKQVMQCLPKPDLIWGKYAVPFVTYGGISSGNSLLESAKLFEKSGRTTVAAMKIESSHIISKKLTTRVNEGMPGDEAIPVVEELVQRIAALANNGKPEVKDFSQELNYHSTKEKFLCKLMNEKMLHNHKYPEFVIEQNKCTRCNKCVTACPVQRISTEDNMTIMAGKDHMCIHCFTCSSICPNEAITFKNCEKDWNEINRILKLVSAKDSFILSGEMPRSAVYPKR